jgi:hypothetical protein
MSIGLYTIFGVANGLHKNYIEIHAAIMKILLCKLILMIFVAKKAPFNYCHRYR